jgi:hypothetical protein
MMGPALPPMIDEPMDTILALTMAIASLKTMGEHMAQTIPESARFYHAAAVLKDLQQREIRTKVNRELSVVRRG